MPEGTRLASSTTAQPEYVEHNFGFKQPDRIVEETELLVELDARIGGGLYVGLTNYDPPPGTIISTDYIVAFGGLHVGEDSDPGTDELWVDMDTRIGGGLYVGSIIIDPDINDIWLDGDIRIGLGLYVGSVSTDPHPGEIWLEKHIEFRAEIADPGVAAANNAKLYIRDNGGGKTQLCMVFSSGAVQILATEP